MRQDLTLAENLAKFDQQQVLRFYDALDEAGQMKLQKQLMELDLCEMDDLAKSHVLQKSAVAIPQRIEPVKIYPRRPRAGQERLYADAIDRGNALLRQGKIAAFLVAGGQGTRLGYDGPKGEFPVTPIQRKPLFQVFAEQLLAWGRDARRAIPWYIMTSDANDAETRAFFEKHSYFGLNPADVFIFQQGMMPAFSLDGKLLLGAKDSLALSPDGHGGSLRALHKSGALDDMKRREVRHLSYFQVDNPLVHTIDPLFLGLHDITGSEMSSKTIAKAGPLEKVGNFAMGDGVLQVIEYSDMPDELAKQTNPDGSLKFDAGSIAIHALSVDFIARLNAAGRLELPWHRAEKKVPYVDEKGNLVKPDKPNAVKLEQFVFDAIPLAKNAIVYETDRAEEFSPVKNAEGTDSPATSERDQVRRAARWLKGAGVEIATDGDEPAATLEISPLFATRELQVRERTLPMKSIERGQKVYFGPDGPEAA